MIKIIQNRIMWHWLHYGIYSTRNAQYSRTTRQ